MSAVRDNFFRKHRRYLGKNPGNFAGKDPGPWNQKDAQQGW